jgi:hypothetical protein
LGESLLRILTTVLNAFFEQGLARVSHRPKLRFSTFSRYEYDPQGGEGVDVYVIDTGINIEHVEFEGRASWGKTVPDNDVDEDNNGHGTHCAGTIASRRYGVAKAANVIAVKVLGSNGSGTMSDVVKGVLWAAEQAMDKAAAADAEYAATGKTKHKGSVANMSLGGGKAQTLDDAVNRAVLNGLHFAVAAGTSPHLSSMASRLKKSQVMISGMLANIRLLVLNGPSLSPPPPLLMNGPTSPTMVLALTSSHQVHLPHFPLEISQTDTI